MRQSLAERNRSRWGSPRGVCHAADLGLVGRSALTVAGYNRLVTVWAANGDAGMVTRMIDAALDAAARGLGHRGAVVAGRDPLCWASARWCGSGWPIGPSSWWPPT